MKTKLSPNTGVIIEGNSLELLPKLPNNSIDAVITDPPYGINGSLYTYYTILPELYRTLKPNTPFITFFSTKLLPQAFSNNPFNYLWQIILSTPRSHLDCPLGILKYMSCLVFTKGTILVKQSSDLFTDNTSSSLINPKEGFINHPTPKSVEFILKLIEMFTLPNSLILDPFSGSGSTLVACQIKGRRFIGMELKRKYCQLTSDRLNKTKHISPPFTHTIILEDKP